MNKLALILILTTVLAHCSLGLLVRSAKYEENKAAMLRLADTLELDFVAEFEQFMESGVRSEKLNAMYRFLKVHPMVREIEEIDDIPEEYARLTCLACRAGATTVISAFRRGADEPTLNRMSTELCQNLNLQTPEVCQGLVDFNIKSMMYIGGQRPNLDARMVCSIVLHGECGDVHPDLEFSIQVDQNAPPLTGSKTESPSKKGKDLKIIHFSDLHYQPTYLVGGETNCPEPMCCREVLGPAQREQDRAGFWGDYRSCDAPWHAVVDAVSQMAKHQDVDLIYYTGDTVDHSIWETSIDFNIGIMDRVYDLFKEKFPGIPVYIAIGNHEAHPTNVFAPPNITDPALTIQWLYDHLADSLARWLPPSALETFRTSGYYTVLIKPGFRIAVLNNNECYTFNWWLQYEQASKAHQLQWLHDLLLAAERIGEKVHIIAHMPSRKRSCYQVWSREFRRIVDRFANTIPAQFNGHTHRDEFFIFYHRERDSFANNVAWNGGSTVSWRNVNPNYIVYNIDSENYHVNDMESYVFNLTEANLHPERNPAWFKLYSFKEAFGLPDLSPATLNDFVYNLARNQTQLLQFFGYKHKISDPYMSRGCDRACQRTTLCDIVVNEMGDNRKCDELVAILNSIPV